MPCAYFSPGRVYFVIYFSLQRLCCISSRSQDMRAILFSTMKTCPVWRKTPFSLFREIVSLFLRNRCAILSVSMKCFSLFINQMCHFSAFDENVDLFSCISSAIFSSPYNVLFSLEVKNCLSLSFNAQPVILIVSTCWCGVSMCRLPNLASITLMCIVVSVMKGEFGVQY